MRQLVRNAGANVGASRRINHILRLITGSRTRLWNGESIPFLEVTADLLLRVGRTDEQKIESAARSLLQGEGG